MGSQILAKTFLVLETLSGKNGGISVTELSRSAGLNISTVHRILGSLMARGYVRQDGERNYSTGLNIINLSSAYLNSLDLKTEAEPFLKDLSGKLNLMVYMATLMDNQIVYIDRHEFFNGLRRYAGIGERRPLYCTALGKVLLTGFSETDLRTYAESAEYNQLTPNTITDAGELIAQVHQAGELGWSHDDEEMEPDTCCRAAPIHDYRGRVIAAISVSGPRETVSGDRQDEVVRELVAAAAGISENLGFYREDRC